MDSLGKGKLAGTLLFVLPLAFLALVFFLPLWEVLGLGLREGGHFTLARFRELLSDPYVRYLLRFTTEQALISSALSFALGFPLGWLLARYRFRGREILRAATLV